MEKKYISHQGEQIRYFLKQGDQKNIIIKVKAGDIYISAPFNAQIWEIEQFLYKHISKIKQVKLQHEISAKYELFGNEKWVLIFDVKVPLMISEENIRTKYLDESIYMKDYNNTSEQLTKLYSFLGKEFKNWFIRRSNMWAEMMGVEFKNLTVKVMKAKWGVCFPTESKIVFNTKLLHFKVEYIDYVIVHELSHLIHNNHSKDFWYNVQKYIPNYKEISKIINSAGV